MYFRFLVAICYTIMVAVWGRGIWVPHWGEENHLIMRIKQFLRMKHVHIQWPSWHIFGRIAVLGIVLCTVTAAVSKPLTTIHPAGLHVQGAYIVDGWGHIVTLIGASRYGLEFDC